MQQLGDSLSMREGCLFIEECEVTALAREFGTPLFVISETHLRRNLRRYKTAFEQCWPEGRVRILPAFKASPLLAVRQILTAEGCGCDVFGHGELEGALRGGVAPADISVNGSIKDREIIRQAVDMGSRIVLDSPRELELCQQEAADLGKTARVMFRIKPFMVELDTVSDFNPELEIRDLTQRIKYGIPTSEVLEMASRINAMPNIEPIGIHVHMGRHSKKEEVWRAWVRHCILLTAQLSQLMDGWRPDEIDFGGGFPSFPDRDPDVMVTGYKGPTLEQYAEIITSTLRDTLAEVGLNAAGILIEVEPGRGIHSDTGIHLTTVKNVKSESKNLQRNWVEIDTSEVFLGISGFNETPPFDFVFASKGDQKDSMVTDIVGMTCNAELLFHQVATPVLEPGDVMAFLNTGSYIETMAANFNALPRPGTVLVCGKLAQVIKRHETIDEVFARDILCSGPPISGD